MSAGEHTFERPFRPVGVRIFNFVGSCARRWGFARPLNAQRILDAACRKTGLHDFGGDEFRQPLELLVHDYEHSAHLHPFGRLCVANLLKTAATNRLLLQAAWKRHPEYLDVPLRRPLYVVGMPRTGTTLLYNLLCQDPAARPLMAWETMFPARTLREEQTENDRPRKFRAKVTIDVMNRMAPSLKSVHAMHADAPEEDGWLMNNTFVSLMFTLNGCIPNYSQYLRELSQAECRRVYEFYATQLQLLQAGDQKRHWVLKSPVHQPTLQALLETVPDAYVVQTHRDPRKVIPSCCSLLSITRGILSDHHDLQESGREFAERMAYAVRRGMEARERFRSRICDVSFENLINDPVGVVQQIYGRLGYQFSAEMELAMRKWLAENPQHKHGPHRYTLEQFGLTEADIEHIFAGYGPLFESSRKLAG